jgi:hypothetical protein
VTLFVIRSSSPFLFSPPNVPARAGEKSFSHCSECVRQRKRKVSGYAFDERGASAFACRARGGGERARRRSGAAGGALHAPPPRRKICREQRFFLAMARNGPYISMATKKILWR